MAKNTDLIYGLHTVRRLLQHAPERIIAVFVQQGRSDNRLLELIDNAKALELRIERLSSKELGKLVAEENHQGIVAECIAAEPLSENALPQLLEQTASPLFLVLDQIQDPHNLGACLRTADAVGATAIIIPRDQSVGLTPIVRKVACGAAETIPLIQVVNLARCLRTLSAAGVWLIGTAADAPVSLFAANLTTPLALILGNEASGLRHLTTDLCDQLIYIPMQGAVESLNVSVAAGVCLFECYRQRNC